MGTARTAKARKTAAKKSTQRRRPTAAKTAVHKRAVKRRPAPSDAPAHGGADAARAIKKPLRSRPVPNLEVDPDVLEFIEAIDRFKKEHARPFPTWSEVLHVLRELGYRRR